MVNPGLKSCVAVLALAALVLGAVAALRSAEYDEQYTLFLTGGVARPVWPETPFAAGEVRALQAGHASLAAIARNLRATDVHPPLYFWAVALWRRLAGDGLFVARLFSVLCGLAALAAVAAVARRVGVPPALAMLLTLGCYGFAYTGAIARGFALAQALTVWGMAVLLAADGRRSRTLTGGLLLGAATFANYLAVFVPLFTSPALRERSVGSRSGPTRGASEGEGRAGTGIVVQRAGWPLTRAATRRPLPLARERFMAAPSPSSSPISGSSCRSAAPVRASSRRSTCSTRRNAWPATPPPTCSAGCRCTSPRRCSPPPQWRSACWRSACAALVAARWRHIAHAAAARWSLAIAAAAPSIGLLLLGLVFHNTPIELRYLAFATPFVALLLARRARQPAAPTRATPPSPCC